MIDKLVLVVDDHPITRKLTVKLLQLMEVDRIIEAGDGADGLAKLADNKADLILLDLSMPVMDGATMLKELKANPDFAQIPVIMITAAAEQARVEEALALGAESYLLKPLAKQPLLEVVNKYLL
ncbi:MAG: hypothetical protein A2508_08445 [Candidatus Lambdaproteobacteria bacterium RIFOXYD12_FULL_49_8]|uniref:Response regulatory domain-containing protein n=1 Tax=Candidatus Lambdaproteobacteria bacterium RIFOXYD2_FULL_50_16 TaxID=1817772 RepID=A0A1F6G4J8_9PROT|nr:MAG: hypothetical protein A2527_13955 [Candidatus Lambdaproteobacteria bacterium RIFOXYD2_FULL_50_16]OGG97371.1 MAG: hypothetical protein A2508_08445 [Candidatus Lambdaproteobacteria bacterium RIFOXYD12_FULL_49_8]